MIKPQHFITIAFVIMLYWVSTIYSLFLLDILIAGLLSIATFRFNYFLNSKLKRPIFAASFSTVTLTILLFSPLIYFAASAAVMVQNIELSQLGKMQQLALSHLSDVSFMPSSYKIKVAAYINNINYEDYLGALLAAAKNVGEETLRFVVNTGLIIVFYFFANLYGRQILEFVQDILPLKPSDSQLIFDEMSEVLSVVLFSTFFNAIFQGFLFAVIAYYMGYDALFLGIAYSFGSLVPVVGGALIWVPCAIYELSTGNETNALLLGVYSVTVISVVADTFIKPLIIEYINKHLVARPTKINSIVIFFAIIAGISVYGFWGIILGPAVTALFISILKIYDRFNQYGGYRAEAM